MARYTGADCKRCRREKVKLFLKGSKCDGPKCPIESRPYPPGQHGRGRAKESEYLLQILLALLSLGHQLARLVSKAPVNQHHSQHSWPLKQQPVVRKNMV